MQVLVLMVPVFFGFMGFAIDLGRLYMARNELKTAANAMALAAAQRLNGTEGSIEAATVYARIPIDATGGVANKYDFGGSTIGETNGTLNSEEPAITFYDASSAAIGAEGATGGEAGGATAKHVRVVVRGEAPTIFWRFLAIGLDGRVNLAAQSVAGQSSPVCQACGVEPIAVQAVSIEDTVDFGFVPGTRYTLGYLCNGGPTPGALANTDSRVPYVMLNRYNEGATFLTDELTQLYRIGSQGLPPASDPAVYCMRVNAEEPVWVNAAPLACNANRVANQVSTFLCGLAARFDNATVPAVCNAVAESDAVLAANPADSDLADIEDYTAYTGNNRRIITVPIVETAAESTMVVLGFRQFLIEPAANDSTINAADQNGRFAALYLGSRIPVKQGRIDGCTQAAGPGKVVLHQ
jgi:Flp pilus assembly protein TadG